MEEVKENLTTTDPDELEKKPVEDRIKEMGRTSIMREGVITLLKIWRSLEMLCFLGAAMMLIWAGSRIPALWNAPEWQAAIKELMGMLPILLAAVLFTRVGWKLPESRFQKIYQNLTGTGR